jgi:hypothetical protein
MMTVSRLFIEAVKSHNEASHELIARLPPRLRIHPSLLSKWINRAQSVRREDERVVAIGALLGLAPESCFEVEVTTDSERQPAEATA